MKICIHIQDLEARGDRWKHAGGETYVIRDIHKDEISAMMGRMEDRFARLEDLLHRLMEK